MPKKDVNSCNAKLSNIGKMIDAQMTFIAKNNKPNYFLFDIQQKMIDNDYEPKCKESFEDVVEKTTKSVFKKIKSTCAVLPTADEIAKCVEKIQKENPIVFYESINEAFAIDQMRKAQAQAFLTAGIIEGEEEGSDVELVPKKSIERDIWQDMFS